MITTQKVEIPEGYIPSENEEYMNEMQLEYFKDKLIKWKQELLKESTETINHLKEDKWHDQDFNDRVNAENETSVELRTRNRYLKLIDKIDAALDRIKNNEYGYCEDTGEKIGIKRLNARPIATLCIEAQERHERNEKLYKNQQKSELILSKNESF